MTVKGLLPGLAERGKIKIGIKGELTKSKDGNEFRLPQKIDHFRIVKNERDAEDNYLPDDEILEILKKNKSTAYDKEGNIVGIPIRLLYNDVDLSFPTQYVSYVNGKLACSGNGEKAHTRDGRETPCPCARLDGAYSGKDKCKISGTLSCIIEGGNVGSCYKFRTTSINSARFILSSLMLIKAATGGLLSFIPLRLVISPKKTIIPATGAPTTIYVVTVEYQGGIDDLQQKALTMGKERMNLIENMRDIEAEARKIVCDEVDQEREEREYAEEFFPETIEIETKPETKKEKEKEVVEKPEKPVEKKVEPDKLLGEPIKTKPEPTPEPVKTEPTSEPKPKFEIMEPDEIVQTEEKPDGPITKDQLRLILGLKNVLKVKDQIEWASLIKKMKFKDVTKANDMTTLQGEKFIEYLRSMIMDDEIPF